MPDHSAPFMLSKSLLIKRQQKRLLFFRRSDKTRRAARISGRLRDGRRLYGGRESRTAAAARNVSRARYARRPSAVRRPRLSPRKICSPPKARQPPKACPPPETFSPAGHVRCPRHNPRSRRRTAKAAVCPASIRSPRPDAAGLKPAGAAHRSLFRPSVQPKIHINGAVPAERPA